MKQQSALQMQHYYGFDYLRSIMALAVVAWHIRLFGISSISDRNEYLFHRITLSDIINFHFFLLAVPVFTLISLFLFSLKAKQAGYFVSRLEYLVYLYLFWCGLWILVRSALTDFCFLHENPVNIFSNIVTGWNSLYYYIFSLILMTILSFFSIKLNYYSLFIWLCVSLFAIGIFPLFVNKENSCQYLVAYWNPLNFLPYVFVAAIVGKKIEECTFNPFSFEFGICILSVIVLFFIFSVYEWNYLVNINNFQFDGYAIPSYTRISVVAGTTAVFLLSFAIQSPPPRCIRLLSDYSLGIYCIHGYIILIYQKLIAPENLCWHKLVEYIFVIIVSLFLSIVLRRAFRKGMI
ncbi:MAG: acyltransferase [Desulfococcaceae bacterium]|nr:acyltransferase [Desulfococcaceae bacterium]